MAKHKDTAYAIIGFLRLISLNLENWVPSPIEKNVKVKNTVLNGSVPNVITGATALAPSDTEW